MSVDWTNEEGLVIHLQSET